LAPTRPTGVRGDEPIKVVEQKLGAEAFAGGGELDHDAALRVIGGFASGHVFGL